MILIVAFLIITYSLLLIKYNKDKFIYISFLFSFVTFIVLSFFPDFSEQLPVIIRNNNKIYLIAALYTLMSSILTFRVEAKNKIYILCSVGLMFIGITNKYIVLVGISYFVVNELLIRIKSEGKKIDTNLFYIIPVIISFTTFSEQLYNLKDFLYAISIFLILAIDIFKMTRSRVIAFYLLLTLMSIINCNETLLLVIFSVSFIFPAYEIYKSIFEKGVDLKKFELADRVHTICLTKRNSAERLYKELVEEKPIESIRKINVMRPVKYENDIRNKFLIMVGIYCVLIIYFFVRA